MASFCSKCGHALVCRVPDHDDRERETCPRCGHVHYNNPNLVAGCLITHRNKVLLVRRAIPPELGRWTLPAGYMEANETAEQAAVREAWEEGRAKVVSEGLYLVYSLPRYNEVYMVFRGELTGFHVGEPGEESTRVGLFDETEIPWAELAFADLVRPALEKLFRDLRERQYSVDYNEISC